jgi:hypothetical protein
MFIRSWLKEVLGAADYLPTDLIAMVAMRACPCAFCAMNLSPTKASAEPSSNIKISLPEFLVWVLNVNITICICAIKTAAMRVVVWTKTASSNTNNFCFKAVSIQGW